MNGQIRASTMDTIKITIQEGKNKKPTGLFSAEIKGISFTFSRKELKFLAILVRNLLSTTPKEWDKGAVVKKRIRKKKDELAKPKQK